MSPRTSANPTAFDFDAPPPLRGTGSCKWDAPRGEGVLPLWIADMDFAAAPPILDALRRRVDLGVFGYPLEPPGWRPALCGWYARRHGWNIDPASVLPSTSLMPLLGAVVRAFCAPGDAVALLSPAYNGFFPEIRRQGVEPLCVPLRPVPPRPGATGDFSAEIDFNALDRALAAPRTKLFLLCNPHNPCGRAWTRDELERVASICRARGVPVASDEIHADLQMPGSRHVPFATVAPDAAAVLLSASKAFNLAGLQNAALVCPDPALRARLAAGLEARGAAEPGPLGFAAAEAAWREGAPWLDALLRHLHGNFLALASFLRERLPALRLAALEATCLAWMDATAAPAAASGSAALARRLEREARVKLSPGSVYGEAPGTAHLRLNLATSRARLLEALDRIAPILGPAPDNPQPKGPQP